MKTFEFTLPLFSLSPPYQQLALVTDPAGVLLGQYPGSSVPNPQRPGRPDRPNLDEYPIVCGGQYAGHYSATGHKHSRPAIVLENDGDVPIYQGGNPRFPAQGKTANFIHAHEGDKDTWRGSAGCMTLAKDGGAWLNGIFAEGEPVLVILPDPFWFAFEGK